MAYQQYTAGHPNAEQVQYDEEGNVYYPRFMQMYHQMQHKNTNTTGFTVVFEGLTNIQVTQLCAALYNCQMYEVIEKMKQSVSTNNSTETEDAKKGAEDTEDAEEDAEVVGEEDAKVVSAGEEKTIAKDDDVVDIDHQNVQKLLALVAQTSTKKKQNVAWADSEETLERMSTDNETPAEKKKFQKSKESKARYQPKQIKRTKIKKRNTPEPQGQRHNEKSGNPSVTEKIIIGKYLCFPIVHTKAVKNGGAVNTKFTNILVYDHNTGKIYLAAVPTRFLRYDDTFDIPPRSDFLDKLKETGKFMIKFGTILSLEPREGTPRIVEVPTNCSNKTLFDLINNQKLTTNDMTLKITGHPIGNDDHAYEFTLTELVSRLRRFKEIPDDILNKWNDVSKKMSDRNWAQGISFFFDPDDEDEDE